MFILLVDGLENSNFRCVGVKIFILISNELYSQNQIIYYGHGNMVVPIKL